MRLPRTRLEAARAKSKFYAPERPCPDGHAPVRYYTSTGSCVQCAKASNRAHAARIRALLAGETVA